MQRRDFLSLTAGAAACGPFPAARDPMQIRPVNPTPGTAFAEACEISNFSRLLFVSGQVPQIAGQPIPPDYRDQYRLAWANVEVQLKAAGMSFDNLVKATIFLSDRALIAQSGGLRRDILGDRTPAITIIIAGIYDADWLLEIEAVAGA
jgi:enamine deaminase RidA (YjgF/YER057c/UK114 family)